MTTSRERAATRKLLQDVSYMLVVGIQSARDEHEKGKYLTYGEIHVKDMRAIIRRIDRRLSKP